MKGLLFTIALLAGIYATTKTATAQPDDSLQKESAVNLLRVINTAEMTYHAQKGKYGDLAQLMKAELLRPESARFPSGKQFNAANPKEPVPGLRLNLSLPEERNSYQTAVFAIGHGWGFYSNQDAVIFEMHPIE